MQPWPTAMSRWERWRSMMGGSSPPGTTSGSGSGNPTAHAELLALADAAAVLGTWRLSEVTLVVTLEPCPMCAGGLVAARVGRLVFGTPDLKAGACGSLYNLCSDPRLNHEVPVTAGVRAAEASEQLRTFFSERRGGNTVD